MSPPPPHTIKFIKSTSPKTLINILSAWSVKLDLNAFSNPSPSVRAELERRIKLLLSDSQRLAVVLPLSKTTYAGLPSWPFAGDPSRRNLEPGTGPMAKKYSQCTSIGKLFVGSGMSRETGEDVYSDACQTLMHLAHGYDVGHGIFLLQDPRQTSAISIRIVDAKAALLDKTLPMIFVLFCHDTREGASPTSPSFRWMQNQVIGGKGISSITTPVDEQHLILRQLIHNSHRLPPGCETMFAAARDSYEKDFIPSFILPLDTLSQSALTTLNRTDTCAACSLPASTMCAACCIVHYCSTTCQSVHRGAHKSFCTRIATSARSVSIHASLKTALVRSLGSQAVAANISRHMSERDLAREIARKEVTVVPEEGMALSQKRRGVKLRFVVKLQVPPQVKGGDIMLYDAGRTFQVFIERAKDPEAYTELYDLVKNCVRWNGLKAFAYARHVEGEKNKERLEILTSVLPDQEQFW